MEDMKTAMPSGYEQGQMPKHGSRGGTLKTLLIIIVALLVIWGLFKVFSGGDAPATDTEDYSVKSADVGEVVSSFPQEFLPEPEATIEGSHELKYAGNGGTLPTVEYTSSRTMAENITAFQKILVDGGWSVTKEASADEKPTTNFYAVKEGNDVNITLTDMGETVKVYIAYIERVPAAQ